jgi:recombination protein RecR
VVEEPKDVLTLERSGGFKGLYHALMGKISPLDGIGPENLEIAHLMQRVKNHRPKEVILATGMDVEGEATALYLSKLLRAQGIMITRIAYGIPVGMGLDYADELTLARALEARRSL